MNSTYIARLRHPDGWQLDEWHAISGGNVIMRITVENGELMYSDFAGKVEDIPAEVVAFVKAWREENRRPSRMEREWDGSLLNHARMMRDVSKPVCRFCKGAGSLADRARNRRVLCNACFGSGNDAGRKWMVA